MVSHFLGLQDECRSGSEGHHQSQNDHEPQPGFALCLPVSNQYNQCPHPFGGSKQQEQLHEPQRPYAADEEDQWNDETEHCENHQAGPQEMGGQYQKGKQHRDEANEQHRYPFLEKNRFYVK